MEIPKNYLYISYDGDGIGRKVGRAILSNDIDELRRISNLIEAGHALIQRWIKDRNGIWINGGGDEGNAAIAKEYIKELEQLRKDYEYLVGATISIGVGKLPSEAGRALLIAKLMGKDRIIVFNKKIENKIKAIKKRARKGAFKSMEEYKLANAYLEKSEEPNDEDDCLYCQQSDGLDTDHCKYCHNAEIKEGEETCKFCGYDNPAGNATTGMDMPELAEQDCAFCQEMDQRAQNDCPYCKIHLEGIATSPDSNNDQAPAGSPEEKNMYDKMGMNPPIIGKPNPDEKPPIGQNPPMDIVSDKEDEPSGDLPGANTAIPIEPNRITIMIDPDDSHSKEALKAIAQQIEKEGNPSQTEVNAIDDTDLPNSNAVEQNVSRPEDFGQSQPQDMGMGGPNPPDEPHNEPDLSEVLIEGLDHEADEIKKEKSIQMIGQALNEFRAAKDNIEAIKLQNPQLYRAYIGILKAMIEMAEMLGLGSTYDENSMEPELGEQQKELMPPPSEKPQNEWNNPFPTHPDFGDKAKQDNATSENNLGAPNTEENEDSIQNSKPISSGIGQSIGKLSAKHTTKHVAKIPKPPGAINAKGQQKIIDPTTGKTRWIDRKQGMVQSTTGVPIKPPKRGNEKKWTSRLT